MLGSVVLDVTIGLIFIFLLYSLLATIIMEMLATFLGLRARNLRMAVSRMLDDRMPVYKGDRFKLIQYFYLLWDGIRQFITPVYGTASARFYEQPIIRLSAEGRFYNKPSYLKPEQFAEALLALFDERETGNDLVDKLNNGLLIPGGGVVSRTTQRHLAMLWEKTGRDLSRFNQEITVWYENTMERAAGWYKRDLQAILLVVGLLLAILFNASTVDLIHILSRDKQAREQLVQLAEAYHSGHYQPDTLSKNALDTLFSIQRQLRQDIEETHSILGLGWQFPDKLKAIKVDEKSWISLQQEPLVGRIDHVVMGDQVKRTHEYYVAVFPTILQAKRLPGVYAIVRSDEGLIAEKIYSWPGIIWRQMTWLTFAGYLMTALAISLGAPFWFDLLNRFIELRSTFRPKDKGPDSAGGGSVWSQNMVREGRQSDTYKVSPLRKDLPDHDIHKLS